MSSGLRNTLNACANGGGCANAGLALDRYVNSLESSRDNNDRNVLLANVCGIKAGANYALAFQRWQTAITGQTTATAQLRVHDRLIVGLGGESVLETAITLHRLYGAPFLPGSALKGLARHFYTHEIPARDDRYLAVLFGETDASAYITYLDAWYVPGSAKGDCPLVRDVMTPHHPDYYGKKGHGAWPTDFDDPIPISFVSATGAFLVAVQGPTPAWAAFALELLKRALSDYGVGGKTSSGYGRLVAEGARILPPTGGRKIDPPPPVQSQLLMAVRGMRNIKSEIGGYVERWRRLPEGEERREVARALQAMIDKGGLLTDAKWREKYWIKEIGDYLAGT